MRIFLNINIKQVDKMQELELYSKIYLHSDISHFINIIHEQLTTMWGITLKIESILVHVKILIVK